MPSRVAPSLREPLLSAEGRGRKDHYTESSTKPTPPTAGATTDQLQVRSAIFSPHPCQVVPWVSWSGCTLSRNWHSRVNTPTHSAMATHPRELTSLPPSPLLPAPAQDLSLLALLYPECASRRKRTVFLRSCSQDPLEGSCGGQVVGCAMGGIVGTSLGRHTCQVPRPEWPCPRVWLTSLP